MKTPLLQTKLNKPAIRPFLVHRQRLIEKLNAGLDRKLTLVAAPAGFGKTTLIADWLSSLADIDINWISLDASDNSLQRFLIYVVAAFQVNNPDFGKSIQKQLNNENEVLIESIMPHLINELSIAKNKQLLVLDDYHEISHPKIHEAMTLLLTHMPAQLHLVMTTRADPPLPLSRLRARGQMTELRSADLRFTHSEAATFLNNQRHLTLSSDEIALLETRTEGWIASLQLAALAIETTSQDRQSFLNDFAGSDRYIIDYLVSEVLAQLPEPIHEFLHQTSILNPLSAPLCDAVRQANDSQTLLNQVERSQLFLFPLDNQRRWYRYHQLFAELLRYRLREQEPAKVAELHNRASLWYAKHDFVEEAMAHAFTAENFDHAAVLIETHAHPFFSAGKFETVLQWMNRLPNTLVMSSPALYLLQGLVLYRSGNFSGLKNHLASVPDNITFTDGQRGELLALQAREAYIRGSFTSAVSLVEQSLALLKMPALQMPTTTLLGWCQEASGNLDAAITAHKAVANTGQEVGDLTGTISALSKLTALYAKTGRWAMTVSYYEQVMEVAQGQQGLHIPLLGVAYIGIGQWHQHQGDKKAAIEHLHKGITMCKRWGGLHIDALRGYAVLLAILQQQGDTEEGQVTRVEAQKFANQPHIPQWAAALIVPAPQATLGDPLTQREMEVLRLIATGLSAPQIAEKLVVGVSTVRSHIKQIYAKLDVHSRHEAVTRAREMSLLV